MTGQEMIQFVTTLYQIAESDCRLEPEDEEKFNKVIESLTEPSGDLISRQAVLDIINERECHEEYCGNHCEGKCSSVCVTIALANKVADLPSVTPTLNEDVLDKIRAEIEQQEKWLMDAGYNQYNVDIAFNAVKLAVDKYKADKE